MSVDYAPFILATAGHVDHGKSSLVRALTGVDPDRLPEEKARSMTIELGFAALDLPGPVDSATGYRLGVVDVPGHEDFVKNMVAGVGSIDLALLVVAADDGWMPQTEEHLHILSYLGVRHGVVALTKADLASDVEAARAAVAQRLEGTFLAGSPIVPTSIGNEECLAALRQVLADTLAVMPAREMSGKPRLPLDRAFLLSGVGTVVTGTLAGGELRQGQAVVVQPTGATARIRTIESHGRPVPIAQPGSRVALNLTGVRPATARKSDHDAVGRGHVVTLAELGEACDRLDLRLTRLDRLRPGDAGTLPPVRSGGRVHVHHGAASTPGRVFLLDDRSLMPGQEGLADVRLDRPIFAFAGDRVVLRDWSSRHTLAGGLILDVGGHQAKHTDRRPWLQARAAAPRSASIWALTQVQRDGMADRKRLLIQSHFPPQAIAAAVKELVAEGQLVSAGNDLLLDAGIWQAHRERAVRAIDEFHAHHPERPGLPLAEVRTHFCADSLADAVIADLCRDGFHRTGTTIRRAAHRPSLPPRLQEAGHRLREQLATGGANPPSRTELAPDATAEQALRFLIINGEAVELAPGCVIGEAALHEAIGRIRAYITRHGPATVSELKTCLDSSRRVMVPLLEHLDRLGVTRRLGDRRTVGGG